MRGIAVTGVSGYLGSLIVQKLEKRDDVERIVGIDWKAPVSVSSKLKFICRDIREPLGDVLLENKVERAIHLAFAVKPSHDREGSRRINIHGARHFLEACERMSVRRFLYLSSHTVYGPYPDNPVPIGEDRPVRPLRSFPYSWDKAEADRMFQEFGERHGDYSVTVVRACSILGPRGAGSVSTGMFKPVMIRLLGYDPFIQFLHEDDLAELLVMLICGEHPGVFNAGGPGPLRYREIVSAAGRLCLPVPAGPLSVLLALTWRLKVQEESPPGGLEFIKYPIVLNTKKVEKETGFRFRYSSREALSSYLGGAREKRRGKVLPA